MRARLMRRPFLAILILLAACAVSCVRRPPPHPSKEPDKLKVLLLPYMQYAALVIGKSRGYFKEQGIAVEFVRARSGKSAVPSFTNGDLDVYTGTPSVGLFNAIARGLDARVVAGMSQLRADGARHLILARKDLVESERLKEPSDLRGLRIHVAALSPFAYYLDELLKKGGLTTEDVELTYLPPSVVVEAISKGRLDVALTGEPRVTLGVRSGKGVGWPPGEGMLPNLQAGVIAFGPRLLRKEPDLGKRFIVAFLRCVRQYNQGKSEENLREMSLLTGHDADLLRDAGWREIRADGALNTQSVIDFQTWAVSRQQQDRVLAKEEFWDSRFVEHARQVLNGNVP